VRITVQDDLAVAVGDRRTDPENRFGGMHFQHLDLGGDLVTGPDRRQEVPGHPEEHAAGPGQVLGNDGVEQTGRHAALDDQPAEASAGGQLLVVVQGVSVPGQLGEQFDVAPRHLPSTPGCAADRCRHRRPPADAIADETPDGETATNASADHQCRKVSSPTSSAATRPVIRSRPRC
jgi:hypothetical protein